VFTKKKNRKKTPNRVPDNTWDNCTLGAALPPLTLHLL